MYTYIKYLLFRVEFSLKMYHRLEDFRRWINEDFRRWINSEIDRWQEAILNQFEPEQ